jgi:NitT/TauT family transport system permease protein
MLTAATDQNQPRWLPPVLVALGAISIVLMWQFLVPAIGIPRFIVPPPYSVLRRIVADYSMLWDNFLPTLIESVAGFALGNSVAVVAAVLFVYSRYLTMAYFPVVLFFNTIPIVALAPIIILFFGLGIFPKIVVASIICFFPTLINMVRGLKAVTSNELELMHVLSASGLEMFWRLRVPRSLPFLFSAFRITATGCVIGAIVGEWIGANFGLGALIIKSTFAYQSELLYAAIIGSSSLAIAIFGLVVLVERQIIHYR